MIFALGKILTTIALSIGTVGAVGCLILGAIVTVNLYWSMIPPNVRILLLATARRYKKRIRGKSDPQGQR